MLLGRFHRAHPHRGFGDIDELDARKRVAEQLAEIERDMVELDADAARANRDQGLQRCEEIVPAPVGIDDVVAVAAPPGLAAIDPGRDGGGVVLRQNEAELAAEIAIEKTGIVADAVVGGENCGINVLGARWARMAFCRRSISAAENGDHSLSPFFHWKTCSMSSVLFDFVMSGIASIGPDGPRPYCRERWPGREVKPAPTL
jgi:hypothetical protein